jgi:plastocyanin
MAADVQVKALDTLAWDKPQVEVQPGDTVTWTFEGTTLAHNVQSASANWSFQSPIGAPAPPFTSAPFTASGRYTFVCQVHQDTMVGAVIVGEPPPPPLSEQPFTNDSGDLSVFETGAFDAAGPTLADVSVRRSGSGARVRFTVSERSRVSARFVRDGRTVKTAQVTAAGTAELIVRKGLRAGRYRIVLRAEDLAGNRSAPLVRRLTVG